MTEYAHQLAGAAWEVAGRRVASSLDGVSSALVVGDDPAAAASAALGIARPQAARRRVAVADLVGETPALDELVSDGDAHGISDSFEFGVSLTRVAHQVDEAGSLFIMPSGSEPVITEEVFRSERWGLLVDSYREANALLLLVAPADAPGLPALARFVDGVVLAGEPGVSTLADVRVLARVAAPPDAATTPTQLAATPLAAEPLAAPGKRPTRSPRVVQPEKKSRLPLVAGGALAAAAAAFFAFSGGSSDESAEGATADTAAGVAVVPPAGPRIVDPRDTATVPPPAAAQAGGGGMPGTLLVVNPGDSARAARFSVLISTFPTADRARARLLQDAPDVAAATIVPAPVAPRFQYVAGAYAAREQADALLARLRRRSAVGSRGGSVTDRPFAFLIREGVPRDSVAAVARGFRAKRIPVYALVQGDGSARLYSGAFENEVEATSAAPALREAGVEPTLAYRTGTP